MRLHHLTVQAFGPFAQRVEVDFDALARGGIFLVHGATGSGKTSLLDAVCFALFARVPGERPAGAALRSHHADAAAVPQVSLELTLGGRRLRITRTPDHHRPKRRGAGVTTVRSTVLLEEHCGAGWACLSTRADETGDLLAPLLGMRLDQFAKVALLPQGDFAAFLRATPEDRRAVLERLFDVRAFTDVEEWLKATRRDLTATADGAAARLQAQLGRLDDELARAPFDADQPRPPWPEIALDDLPAVVTELTTQVHQLAATALAHRDAAVADADAAEAAWQQARATDVLRTQGVRAQAELARLAEGAADRAAATAQVERAERAGRLAGDLRALTEAHQRARAAHDEAVSAARRIAELGLALPSDVALDRPVDLGQADLDDFLAVTMAGLRAHDTPLSAVATLSRRLADARARASVADAEAATARHTRQARATDLDKAVAAAATIREQMARTAPAAAEVAAAETAVARLAALVRVRSELDEAEAARLRLREQSVAAGEAALAAEQQVLALRQLRLDGMAAELAGALREGGPCPVCGSCSHPRPATAAERVSADDVTAAESRCAPLQAAADQVRRELAAVDALITARDADLDGERGSIVELRAALAIARDTAHSAVTAQQEHARLTEHAVVADAHTDQCRTALETAATVAADVDGRLAELTAARAADTAEVRTILDAHARSCPCAVSSPAGDLDADPEDIIEGHRLAVAAVADLAAAQTRVHAAYRQAAAAETAAHRLCLAEGFRHSEHAQAALLSPDRILGIRSALGQDDRSAAAAQGVLADPLVQESLAGPAPDLAEVQTRAVAARTTRSQADRAHGLAESVARGFGQVAAAIPELVAQAQRTAERADLVARLADTVSGLGADNVLRMRLSAFVLAARLERVVALANDRLARMGEGRYRLEHDDSLAPSGRRSGLGLRVRDLWTGQHRDTATLSGGESFMASLALALGLADAVQEESGGAALETLFIDEGFGTLDDESLEQVMSVLDDLRDGGRCVGVVSHVGELRTRIPTQVQVVKASAGSTLHQITGAA